MVCDFLRHVLSLLLVSFTSHYMADSGEPVEMKEVPSSCQVAFFTQKLDHFNVSNSETYQQRYVSCQEHWASGGPVFLFTGSEADVMVFVKNSGFVFELAKELNGTVIFAEHRYYGQSLPSYELNFTDAEYMPIGLRDTRLAQLFSVSNAMADFKTLVESVKRNTTGMESAAVITVGGSYSGLLAGWMRMKYPDVITGALSSSAPTPFYGGSEPMPCNLMVKALTEIYKSVSNSCADGIRASWDALHRLAENEAGRTWLATTFRTCPESSDISAQELEVQLGWRLKMAWYYIALANYPYAADFYNPLPGNPVKMACSHFDQYGANSTDRDLILAVARASSIFCNHTGQAACFPVREPVCNEANWPQPPWKYQGCRELFVHLCNDGIDDFFPKQIYELEGKRNYCRHITGFDPNPSYLVQEFGGGDLRNYSNIIFSNGKLDPWYGGGIGKAHETPGITVVSIDDAAHHLDLFASHPNDPVSVTQARQLELSTIRGWIQVIQPANLSLEQRDLL